MILRFHVLEHVRDAAGLVDHECRPGGRDVFLSIHRLLDHDVVRRRDPRVFVDEQRVRELVFLLELAVFFRRIPADAEDDCIDSLEPREGVSKRARLDGSARGVVFRIEEQDDYLSAQRRQLELRVGIGSRGEIRRHLTCRDRHTFSPPINTAMIAFWM